MVVEYALLTIEPDAVDTFEERIPAAREILLSSPGCRSVTFLHSVDRPEVFLMKVGWDRIEDHLEVFAGSELAPRLAGVIGELFAEAPVVAHFTE